MNRLALALFACAVILWPSCGGNDEKPAACGAIMCGPRQACDVATSPPACRCLEAYSGTDCSACARGFEKAIDGSCQAVAIDCSKNASICGRNGTCKVTGTGLDECTCSAGYAGRTCQTCTAGFQDNDNNGTCTATCTALVTMMSCAPPLVCSDATGAAKCACPPNSTGASCEQCLTGFKRAADNTCVKCADNTIGEKCDQCRAGFVMTADGQCAKSCTAAECGTNGVCDTTKPIPACVCKPGYAGTGCSECDAGYTRDAASGLCVSAIPATTRFLGVGSVRSTRMLLAIDPVGKTAVAVQPMFGGTSVAKLTADTATKTLFALDTTGGINRVDLKTGALTKLATITSTSTLAFGKGSLFTVPSLSPYLLKSINPTTGAVADLGPTTIVSAQALAFDATSSTLLAARSLGSMRELYRIEAAQGAATKLGPVVYPDMPLAPANNKAEVAFEPVSGAPYMIAGVGRTATALLTTHCQAMAQGLGFAAYATLPLASARTAYNGTGAGGTTVINSVAATGPEIVAYASYGSRSLAKATIQIATTNPATFVCMMTYEENLKLFIPATAKFAAIGFAGTRPTLSLEVEPGFPAQTLPTLHVYSGTSGSLDSSVRAYAVSQVYDQSQWVTVKKLPVYTSLWDTDSAAPIRLMELDLAGLTPKRFIDFEGVTLEPMIAPWVP
ncbi:MAG: hypothetical protein SF187_24440 [Deltaproteobacteria bacterium]|nr:hypothetical protein [Deltaproteobacteria bacterium]